MEELQKTLFQQPSSGDQKDPGPATKLGWNTCYIVCGMVIKDDKVLMIQEAKPSCRGMWYMPAGRVEKNESLEDAVKREVKEEAGYEFSPKALVAVECQSLSWIRFTFVGDIAGGKIKTPDQEDKESIQAQWMSADRKKLRLEARLRANDCLQLIEIASKWNSEDETKRCKELIVPSPYTSATIKVVLVRQNGDEVFVLLKNNPDVSRIPFSNSERSGVCASIEKTLNSTGYSSKDYEIHGILSVEHKVEGGDGVCMSVLLSTNSSELSSGCNFSWQSVTDPACSQRIRKIIKKEQYLIQLIDLWG